MNTDKEHIESKKYSATLSTLYSFWKDLSGHSVRFARNHGDNYAFQRIEQTDSLRYSKNSVFL